jgi:hypothetical protein
MPCVNCSFCAERGLPICYTPGDILGASTPVTLAGGIVQATAEALSGIVLHQVRAKGAPIISGFVLAPLDMKKGTICYGAPEFRLTNSAFADIFHHYGLPIWSTVGSDAQCLDAQAAMEHAWGALLAALDGANLIHDVGYLGQGLVSNPAAIVMCNEIIGLCQARRPRPGPEPRKDRPGGDPPGGPRRALFDPGAHQGPLCRGAVGPQLLNRDSPDSWATAGQPHLRGGGHPPGAGDPGQPPATAAASGHCRADRSDRAAGGGGAGRPAVRVVGGRPPLGESSKGRDW